MKTVRLMRHSTTIDGKNDVKNGFRSTALAILAGAFDKIRNYTKAFSSPMQRAIETAELVLQYMGLSIPITTDDSFAGAPSNIIEIVHSDDFKKISSENNLTVEETFLSGLAGDAINNFVKERGRNGLQLIKQIINDLGKEESAIIFCHSGPQIEPIAVAAKRELNGNVSEDVFTLNELPEGMCWETESYVLEFSDDNQLNKVYKIGYQDVSIIDLIKLAKTERI